MENWEEKYNFKTVEKGVLYRSAQPDSEFFFYLKNKYGIKTIVNLRHKTKISEKKAVRDLEMNLFPLPLGFKPFLWFKNPSGKDVFSFLEIFKTRENLPVLLHCRKGKDRTGLMTAFFRFFRQGWAEKEVKEEMKRKKVNLYWIIFFRIKIKTFKRKNGNAD
jgi:tyrosine-protein phosphatase SIW14